MDIKKVFSNNVLRIIIESFNLCNRKCYMCPQSLNLRKDQYEEFPQELFEKLLLDLASINYSNTIAFGRYHEPLMFIDITLQRIARVRKLLPNAKILLNTNGDFINLDVIRKLAETGLSDLKIMRYQNGTFSDKNAEELCLKMIHMLKLQVISEQYEKGIIRKYIIEPQLGMKVSIKSENYDVASRGCNRGGLLSNFDDYGRTLPCDVPMKNIDIDYNGNILPCNNLLSDAPQHKPYVIGNLRTISIFEAYERCFTSDFVLRIRNGDFSKDYVCQKCSYFYNTDAKELITM